MDSPLLPDQLDAATMCQPLQAHPRRSWFSCWRMKSIQGIRSRLDWDSVNMCQQVKSKMNKCGMVGSHKLVVLVCFGGRGWGSRERFKKHVGLLVCCSMSCQCVSLWNLLAGMSCVDIVAASLTPHRPLIEGQTTPIPKLSASHKLRFTNDHSKRQQSRLNN